MRDVPGVVVDASIARACGTSGTPPSPDCAAVLAAVLAGHCNGHLSSELRAEWSKHKSRYFNRWWKVMTSRRRIEPRRLTKLEALIGRLHDEANTPAQASAMIKDAHLAQGGIEHEGRILSLDDTVRHLFASVAQKIPELAPVLWANPAKPAEKVLPWIEAHVPEDAKRRLGEFPHAA